MKPLWIVLALALAPGCVSMKRYDALDAKYTRTEQEVAKLKAELARRDAFAAARLAQLRELIADFKPLIDRGVLEVEVVDGRVVIGMAADVLFPSGSASLSDGGKENLRQVAQLLARRPDYEFQVEGHTDDDAINTPQFPNNWYLGAARAITVTEYLVAHGMDPGNLSAASFGQYAPVEHNDSAADKAKNRRIELVLLPDLSELPGYQALMEQKERPVHKRPKRRNQGK